MEANIDAPILDVNRHIYCGFPYPSGMKSSSPTDWNTFGDRVYGLRKTQGMSQVALAKKAGIKQSSLSDIENNETTIDDLKAPTLLGLSRALKIDPEFLANGSGNPLQFQLVEVYRSLSDRGRDELLGYANRVYSQEHPNDLAARPFSRAPQTPQLSGSKSRARA